MRRKNIVASLILSAIVICGAVFFFLQSTHDPVYQGKRLSVWLKEYDFKKSADGKELIAGDMRKVDEIVKQAGTNAIPTLLRLLREEDSKKHNIDSNGEEASDGFRVLGASATNAVPDLIKIYEQNPTARVDVLYCLGCIGPAAEEIVPWLIQKLPDTNDKVRDGIVTSLGEIHSQSDRVVPILISYLNDSSSSVRGGAALALGEYRTDAKPAIPQLISLLNDKGKGVRNCATLAIKEIDPEAAVKAGLK